MTTTTPAPDKVPAKHGRLAGGALTAEVLDSSPRVLARSRGGQGSLVGLQQWFTPPEAAELIARVMSMRDPEDDKGWGASTSSVLDITAGAGDLLGPYPAHRRFGIEIDPDHTGSAPYEPITADVQDAVPLMRALGLTFPRIVLNPPFGLSWRDPVHGAGQMNSALLAYLWALDLLDDGGQGAIILGTDRLDRDLLSRPQAQGVHTIVDVDGPLFDGVALPVSIAFFVHGQNRKPSPTADPQKPFAPVRLKVRREALSGLARNLVGLRKNSTDFISFYSSMHSHIAETFATVAQECRRRQDAVSANRKKISHDVTLRGERIRIALSPFARLAVAEESDRRNIQLLHNQNVQYLGHNTRDWRRVEELETRGLLTVSPRLREKAVEVLDDAIRKSTPLFPVAPQMRLGWLVDLDRIPCVKSDPDKGFEAGQSYDIQTSTAMLDDEETRVVNRRDGEPELRRFITERRILKIRIATAEFDESPEDIEYLTEHFDLPDPGCVASRYPKELHQARAVLDELEAEIREHHRRYHQDNAIPDYEPFVFKAFQKDHMSRLLVKGRGMIAHQQGLGKTLQLLTLAKAQIKLGAKPQVLHVTKQDLVDQWREEARKYFGHELEEIRTSPQARAVADRIRAGEPGTWITYFECLSIVGRKLDLLDPVPLDPKRDLENRLFAFKENKRITAPPASEVQPPDPLQAAFEDAPTPVLEYDDPPPADTATETPRPDAEDITARMTSRVACPKCRTDTRHGWNGVVCENCGHVHRRRYAKPAYSHLTSVFKRGVVCVDEVSEIRGDDSLRSKSVRALARGPYRYGATGTPMTNFVSDSFNGLAFCLGTGTAAFPYSHDGRAAFERDFAVIEYMMGRKDDEEEHLRKRRRVLPRVANVSQFWRLTQPGVSRCRKEQTGEPLVDKTYIPIRVPMGIEQLKAHEFWLDNFAEYFMWKYPDHELADKQTIERFAAALGQLWRLETAATLPASDGPSQEWPTARKALANTSNYTPATMKVLELAMHHAARGDKVLIGSDLVDTGPWMAARLREKGIDAVHTTDEKLGRAVTKSPRKRAAAIQAFRTGDAQVLCCGMAAMQLGHNLDMTQVAIVHGLHYSYGVFSQFIERVHRLTSKKPVSIYTIIPRHSLAERKWSLLRDKGDSADLAFDGELFVQNEKPVDWNKILKEMREQGIKPTGDELPEADVEAAWRRVAPLAFLPSVNAPPNLAWPPSTPGRTSRHQGAPTLPLAAGAENLHVGAASLFGLEPSRAPATKTPSLQPSLF